MPREDLPLVSGRVEDVLNDIKASWDKYSSLLPIALFIISMVVAYDVIKKRWLK